MAHSKPAILLGTANVNTMSKEVLDGMFTTLEKHNVKELDTAYVYIDSEEILGKAAAPSKFIVHTKAPGWRLGAMTKDKVIDGMNESLRRLGASSVDVYYLHAPDEATPIKQTLEAIQQLYKEGKFKRFGLSNFKAPDVQKIYDIQSSAGSVLPSVFQGCYNAVARHVENDLFPLLRKLKISFFAYSPIAGGFLVKTSAQMKANDTHGKFAPNTRVGDIYISLYGRDTLVQALDDWELIASNAGISKAALAYRWITYHSALKKEHEDAVIVGASKVTQLEETLKAIEDGPLDAKTVERVEQIWEKVQHEAPLDNYHSASIKI